MTRLKAMTPRNWGQSLLACIGELNRYIKGWVAYYLQWSEEAVRNWKKMDAHVRRRLRAIVIRQKKRPRTSTAICSVGTCPPARRP